jgi:hypothetical protein
MDVSPQQIASVSAALIPFLEHDDGHRALMGCNMMRQAVPLLHNDSPIVGTGLEKQVCEDSRTMIVAEGDGVIEFVDATTIRILYDREEEEEYERRERRERKSRFDNDAIEKYRKKKDETEEVPAISAGEAPAMIEAGEAPVMIEAPADDESEPAPVEEPKPKAKRTLRGKKSSDKVLSPEQTQYRDMLLDLATTHNAKILGEGNSVIREVAVKNLVNSLKEDSEGVVAIVFDGVISQRILDISAEKGINTVIGTRKGNISKMPAEITIWTKEDLY